MEQWQILIVVFPSVAALIGWFTNFVALKLLFRPHDPVNILGFKLQGVLPKRLDEYAHKMADITTGNFFETRDIVEAVDPLRLLEESRPLFDEFFDESIEEVKKQLPPESPALKMLNPQAASAIKKEIWGKILSEAPKAMEKILAEANDLLDMNEMIYQKVSDIGAAGIEEIIVGISRQQLKWIEYLGAIYGTLLGFMQFGLVQLFPVADEGKVGLVIKLAMPLFGSVVGLVTNWFAVQMMWYPRERRGWWIFSWQGMFPSNQDEIQSRIIDVAAEQFIFPSEIFEILSERLSEGNLEESVARVDEVLGEKAPGVKKLMEQMLTPEQREALTKTLAAKASERLPRVREQVVDYAEKNIDVSAILHAKVDDMDKEAFEKLNRDLYAAEEIWLILYGGVLGAIMGGAQLGIYILTYAWQHKEELGNAISQVSMLF